MSDNPRDPGLQPERTSMSWLRTHMLMFGLSLLMMRFGDINNSLLLQLNGVVVLFGSFIGVYYSRRRFTALLNLEDAVGDREISAKKWLALVVVVSAITYAVTSVIRFTQ